MNLQEYKGERKKEKSNVLRVLPLQKTRQEVLGDPRNKKKRERNKPKHHPPREKKQRTVLFIMEGKRRKTEGQGKNLLDLQANEKTTPNSCPSSGKKTSAYRKK